MAEKQVKLNIRLVKLIQWKYKQKKEWKREQNSWELQDETKLSEVYMTGVWGGGGEGKGKKKRDGEAEQQRQKARGGQAGGQRAHSGEKISEEIMASNVLNLIWDTNLQWTLSRVSTNEIIDPNSVGLIVHSVLFLLPYSKYCWESPGISKLSTAF